MLVKQFLSFLSDSIQLVLSADREKFTFGEPQMICVVIVH